jgi:LAO/AO transport system kinase
MAWCEAGRRVAVLAIDPSSGVSRGSVLGDKSRMERLSQRPDAFVRPSPTGGHLGGVALATRETIRLVEAAGFGYVLVETVGVGQSETAARQVADLFVLAAQPGAGDDLQGIKRGIMEHADLIAVAKRDALPDAAAATVRSLRASLSILPPPTPDALEPHRRVVSLSSTTGEGIDTLSARIDALEEVRRESGALAQRRRDQASDALESTFQAALLARIHALPSFPDTLRRAQQSAREGDEAAALSALLALVPLGE